MGKNVGLIGGVRGKVGNVVFSTRRGVQIARAYQPVVANPGTKRQELSRAKLAIATNIMKAFRLFLRAGWQKYYPTYEVQKGIGYAIPVSSGCITGTDPAHLTVDYMHLQQAFSATDLPLASYSGLDFSDDEEVTFSCTPIAEHFMDADGNAVGAGVVVAMYQPDTGYVTVAYEVLDPSLTPTAVHIPFAPEMSGLKVHIYAFVKQIPNAQNGIQSDSLPWMYPAATSWCSYVGTGTLS